MTQRMIEISERIARTESRQDLMERVQQDHELQLGSLDSKLDKLIIQVRDIKWVLAMIAAGTAMSAPWERLLSISDIIVKFIK